MSTFTKTLTAFCSELRLTFPELETMITRASVISPSMFWNNWVSTLEILLYRDADKLFKTRKGFLMGAVRLTSEVWGELSENTQNVIWTYLRTLCLESAKEVGLEGMSNESLQILSNILLAERMEADPESTTSDMFEESMKNLQPMMDRIKEVLGTDFKIDPEHMKLPELPPHLKTGRIAKLLETLSKQLNPEEFGIDPAMFKSDNPTALLKQLLNMFNENPKPMMEGIKKLQAKIQAQIKGGTLDQKELMKEAKEFHDLLKDHPLLKEVMSKFKMAGPAADLFSQFVSSSSSSGEPSERLRLVRERLQKKIIARGTKK